MLTDVNPVPPWIVDSSLVILGAFLSYLSRSIFLKREETKANERRIAALESQLALVNAAVVPIATAFQAILIKELTHFHTPEMDALLVKVGPPRVLTIEEAARLVVMLEERAHDWSYSDSERDAASILPAVMRRASAEQKLLQNASSLSVTNLPVSSK